MAPFPKMKNQTTRNDQRRRPTREGSGRRGKLLETPMEGGQREEVNLLRGGNEHGGPCRGRVSAPSREPGSLPSSGSCCPGNEPVPGGVKVRRAVGGVVEGMAFEVC